MERLEGVSCGMRRPPKGENGNLRRQLEEAKGNKGHGQTNETTTDPRGKGKGPVTQPLTGGMSSSGLGPEWASGPTPGPTWESGTNKHIVLGRDSTQENPQGTGEGGAWVDVVKRGRRYTPPQETAGPKSAEEIEANKRKEKKALERKVTKALGPRTEPVNFASVFFEVNDSRQLLKTLPRERTNFVWAIVRRMKISDYVVSHTVIPGPAVQLFCYSGSVNIIKHAIRASNNRLIDDADPFGKPKHSNQPDEIALKLTATRIAFTLQR